MLVSCSGGPTSGGPTSGGPTSDAPAPTAPRPDAARDAAVPGASSPASRASCLQAGVTAPPFRRWFQDETTRAGVAPGAIAPAPGALWRGVAAGDVDGDGDLDLVVASGHDASGRGATRWLANDGAMRFTVSDAALSAGQAVLLADFDNDGDLDLVVGDTAVVLHEGLGAGRFGAPVRLATLTRPALSLSAGDLDGDGRLDLAVGGEQELLVLANTGGLALRDASTRWSFALEPRGHVHSSMIFDIDEDGALDLFVNFDFDAIDAGEGPAPGAMGGDAAMLRRGERDGRPHFEDHARRLGLFGPRAGMGLSLGDLDGDGDLDLYLSNIGRNHLLLRGADGTFTESSDRFNLGFTWRADATCADPTNLRRCMKFSWMQQRADFDGDGHDDLAVASARFTQETQLPLFLQGDGRGGYQRIDPNLDCFSARTLIAADLDGDGDPDLVSTSVLGELLLLRNVTESAPRRCVRLRGVESNREGRGALITGVSASGRRLPKVMAPGGGVLGDGPASVCFGVGADPVVRYEVRWPSGRQQTAVAEDGTVTLQEPDSNTPNG
ncbi:MAG: CRTAC1 family protein [Polyangiales bacterium]